ncbi:MAG TPA: hypothetical protein VH542_06135 [Steroidobacteraceae bacterium]|jgi:hypothetical protein
MSCAGPGRREVARASVVSGAVILGLVAPLHAATIADAEADWTARSTAPGVFYKNNFDFGSTAELVASNYQGTTFPERAQLETVNKLSGRGAFKANIPKTSSEGTVAYRHSFDMPVGAQTKSTRKTSLYYQFEIYLPSYILDHRFATVGNTNNVGHKFAIIQEPDSSFNTGEVVVMNYRFRRFVTAYRMRSSGSADQMVKQWNTSPCTGQPEYGWQDAIDAGPQASGGQTDATSCALFKRRYGPMQYSFSGTNSYGGGTLTAQGNPDPDAAVNGEVWAPDAWNVVEVYIDQPSQTIKIWHAKRGDAPKLVINQAGSADLGNNSQNYTGVQLLPRLEELTGDSSRQDTYAIYDEIIASTQFINFPGVAGPVVAKPQPPSSVQAR